MRRVLVEAGCPLVEAAVCRPWVGRPLVALAVGRLLAGVAVCLLAPAGAVVVS